MRIGRASVFAMSFLLILASVVLEPASITAGFHTPLETDSSALISEDSYFFDRNRSIQIVFVGFNESMINQTGFLDVLPSWNDINYTSETVRHWIDYSFVFACSEYEQELKNVIQSNSNTSAVGTEFNQTLFQRYLEGLGTAAAAFDERAGMAIEGSAIESWLENNPASQVSSNTWCLYVLNFTEIDSYDHSQDHWYSYTTTDHDTGSGIDWLPLKNGAIVNDLIFQYVGTAGLGRSVLLDPSANQWYLRYCMAEYNSTLEANESWPLFMSKDLDDIQRLFNLDTVEGVNNLSEYLAEYSRAVISNLLVPGTSPDSGGLSPPSWFTALLDTVDMHLDIFVVDDSIDPDSVLWSLDDDYVNEVLSDALLFPRFNLTISSMRIEEEPEYEILFWRNAVTVNGHTFVNATELIHDLELTFPPLQSWSTNGIHGTVFLMSNMTMISPLSNVTNVFSECNFAICQDLEVLYGLHGAHPRRGLTNQVVETASYILGLNSSSYLRNYVADFGRGVTSKMIRTDAYSIFETTAFRMMYLDRLEIQLITDFIGKDAVYADQATSATSRARIGALREFALADAAIVNWSWENAYEHLILARDWTNRMWWSKLDTTRPTISEWDLEGNYTGGEPYRVWASVDDTLSGVENVSVFLRTPDDLIVKYLLISNGTYWVIDLPAFSMNGTYQLWIVSYDWGMNVATSNRQTIAYSSIRTTIVDPSETLLVVVVSSAGFALLMISLSLLYDKRRKP